MAETDEVKILKARLKLAERRIAWLEAQIAAWQHHALAQHRARTRFIAALAIGEATLAWEEQQQAQD